MKVTLLGIGMGSGSLTGEAQAALGEADVLLGARRVLDSIPGFCGERVATYAPGEILSFLQSHPGCRRAVVAYSGDTGFYSGARQLLPLLEEHGIPAEVLPGISTVQALAARLGIPWQEFCLVSAHGVDTDVLAPLLNHPSVFYLTGGKWTPGAICGEFCRAGLGDTLVTVASNLSYPEEEVVTATAKEIAHRPFPSLSALLARRQKPSFRREFGSFGIPDSAFLRGEVPMTKAEVRAVILSKLRLSPHSVAYDVGAGTGSVSVEMAFAAHWGRIYAIEENPAALELIAANRERFGAYNMEVVPGRAPGSLKPLPPPDAVFVGGSKGELQGILEAVLEKNPRCRVAISAVTLETLAQGTTLLTRLGLSGAEWVQIGVSRAKPLGSSHLLMAQNPIFLLAAGGEEPSW